MTDRREAVRANANYLRNVRPIDPEEINEYVEGRPHPAVVRQILREEAVDLGLVEREDGTFVPVEDEPVPPLGGPVERVPGAYADRLEDLLVERYGPAWHEGGAGDLLRSTIRRFKASYLEGRPVDYDEDVAAGYAIYHLPAYYAAVQYALDDLAERGLLGRSLRVLDVGAGVGGPALGLCDYLPADALVDYHAVEPGAAADVLEALLAETGRNVHPTVHREPAEPFLGLESDDGPDPDAVDDAREATPEEYDLVLCCNVLSELEDPEAVLRACLEVVAPDGSVLATAPADRETSIGLRELERAVEGVDASPQAGSDASPRAGSGAGGAETDRGPVTVYGPTVRLWPGETPSDRGWSFDVRPDLEVPAFQRLLDEAAGDDASDADGSGRDPGEFVNVDVQFSYSILRVDGTRRIEVDLDPGRWAKMAEMDRHVTNRIDLAAAKLSRSLSDAGPDRGGRTRRGDASDRNPLFKISDGSEDVDHYAVVTTETASNRPLLEADYGEVLTLEGALALWNDDERAYNLVVDDETVVDRIG